MEQANMTPEIAQQIDHASTAIGQTVKTLIDTGMETPAIATAITGQFINFLALVSAVQGFPREEVMKRILGAIEAMEPYCLERFDLVKAEIENRAKDGNDEQQ